MSSPTEIDVTQALQAGDPAAVQRIADAWNTTWDLKPGIDLKKFPRPARTRSTPCCRRARWSWSPTTAGGAPRRSPAGHGVAARRRRQDRINNGSFHVIDVATGSSGTLTTRTPTRAVNSVRRHQAADLRPAGPAGSAASPPRVRQCTPATRSPPTPDADANARLNPVSDDAFSQTEGLAETKPVQRRQPGRRPGHPERRTTDRCASAISRPTRGWRHRRGHRPLLRRRRRHHGGRRHLGHHRPADPCATAIDVLLAAPAARRQQLRPARRPWTATRCAPVTATTCPATATRRSTDHRRPTAVTIDPEQTRLPATRRRSCGETCRRCRCTVSSAR